MLVARAALVALVVLASLAHASTPLLYPNVSVTLAVMPASTLPLTLAAGPDGGTTIGANATSASSTVTSNIFSAATFNTTSLTNTGGAAVQIRLTLTGTTSINECQRCHIQLRVGGTTWSQIEVDGGTVTKSSGAWVTMQASPGAQSKLWIYAVAQGSIVADRVQTLSYAIEIQPDGGGSPTATYTTLSTGFRV